MMIMTASNLKWFSAKPKTHTAYCGHTLHISFCLQVAYTFDAGPNACLYLLEHEVPKLVSVICQIFPPENEGVEYLQGIPVEKQAVSQVNKNAVSISFQFHKTHTISVTVLSNSIWLLHIL